MEEAGKALCRQTFEVTFWFDGRVVNTACPSKLFFSNLC